MDQKEPPKMPSWIGIVLALILIVVLVVGVKSFLFAPKEIEDPVVAIVNTERIRLSYLDKKYNEMGPERALQTSRDEFLDQLIDQRILIQEAKRRNISIAPQEVLNAYDLLLNKSRLTREKFRTQMITRNLTEDDILSTIQNTLLIEELIADVMPENLSDEEDLKRVYDANKASFTLKDAVRASHIMVKDIEVALDLIKRARAGEDFGLLAQNLSLDPRAKTSKGDLGWFQKGMLPDEVETVAYALKVGEVSGPIRSEKGWIVLKVTAKQSTLSMNFEQAQPTFEKEFTQNLRKELVQQLLKELKSRSKIEKFEI